MNWLRSKTLWFGYALVFLPIIQTQWDVWGTLVPEKVRPFALSVIGMIVIGLRMQTTKPLSEK